uniref:RxLR effector protein n=1 Tax=Hyaloperonospora arabidopsidis (strain Emoy2) TaxID=559515 RepID=M4C3K3_HYAAE
MLSPGKLLSTVAVALLVHGSVAVADTPTTSTSSLRLSDLTAGDDQSKAANGDAQADDERLWPPIYASVVARPYIDKLAKNPPHPKPPKLSEETKQAQQQLLLLSGKHPDTHFEAWLWHLSKDEAKQKAVFKEWASINMSPNALATLLHRAGKHYRHHDPTGTVVRNYEAFREELKANDNRR